MTDDIRDGRDPHLRIEANPYRVRAMFAGHVIADTTEALTVHRPGHAPIQVFPREDVELSFFGKTARVHTDALGAGACYTLAMEGEILEEAACVYDDPAPGLDALRGCVSLAEDHFEIYALTPRDMAAAPRATHAHRSVV